MKNGLSIYAIILSFFLPWSGLASYQVTGKVNLSSQWQPQIFMAAIHKLDDYYNAYPDLVIDAAIVQPDGSFILAGDNLPDEKKFYRLYLMKQENSEFDACLYVGGDDHNFMHVILDNNSALHIQADDSSRAPFGNYTIQGDYDNQMMRTVSQIVLPSFYFYQIKYTSELRFTQEKLNRDLLDFADTCTSTMASLAAMNNSDFDKYYVANKSVYQSFVKRLNKEYPENSYTLDYRRKMEYYDPLAKRTPSAWKDIVIGLLVLICLILLWNIHQLKKYSKYNNDQSTRASDSLDQLTFKEREILKLIAQGMSNKEIAGTLFIELSTVKTHINKIYSKLGISSRNEVYKFSGNP